MLVSPDVSVRANLGIVVASKSQFMREPGFANIAALAQLGISLGNPFIGIASDRHRDLPAGLAVAVSHYIPARHLFRNPVGRPLHRINVNHAAVLVCHVVDGISRHEAVGIQRVVDQADALNQRHLASGKSPLADIADPAAVNIDIVIPSAPVELVGSGLDMGQLEFFRSGHFLAKLPDQLDLFLLALASLDLHLLQAGIDPIVLLPVDHLGRQLLTRRCNWLTSFKQTGNRQKCSGKGQPLFQFHSSYTHNH